MHVRIKDGNERLTFGAGEWIAILTFVVVQAVAGLGAFYAVKSQTAIIDDRLERLTPAVQQVSDQVRQLDRFEIQPALAHQRHHHRFNSRLLIPCSIDRQARGLTPATKAASVAFVVSAGGISPLA